MNLSEQMYTDLKSQLPALTEAIKSGVEYGGELFHRFILFDIWTHVLSSVFIFIPAISFSIASYQSYKRSEWKSGEPSNAAAFFFTLFTPLAAFFSGVLPVFLFVDTKTILKDIFIPELRVLEILSSLVSNS